MMTIEEEMILNRVATALETIARQKMGAEPVKADEDLEDVYADEVIDWMGKYSPDLRDVIRATAYHFLQLGVEWEKEQDTRDMIMSDGREFQKCYELGKKDTTERAIAWLKEHANDYIVDLTPTYPDAPVNIVVGGKCWIDLKEYLED